MYGNIQFITPIKVLLGCGYKGTSSSRHLTPGTRLPSSRSKIYTVLSSI